MTTARTSSADARLKQAAAFLGMVCLAPVVFLVLTWVLAPALFPQNLPEAVLHGQPGWIFALPGMITIVAMMAFLFWRKSQGDDVEKHFLFMSLGSILSVFLFGWLASTTPYFPGKWAVVAMSWNSVLKAEEAMGRPTPLGQKVREGMQTKDSLMAMGMAPHDLDFAWVATREDLQTVLILKKVFGANDPTLDFIAQNGLMRRDDVIALRQILVAQYDRDDLSPDQLALVASLGGGP